MPEFIKISCLSEDTCLISFYVRGGRLFSAQKKDFLKSLSPLLGYLFKGHNLNGCKWSSKKTSDRTYDYQLFLYEV